MSCLNNENYLEDFMSENLEHLEGPGEENQEVWESLFEAIDKRFDVGSESTPARRVPLKPPPFSINKSHNAMLVEHYLHLAHQQVKQRDFVSLPDKVDSELWLIEQGFTSAQARLRAGFVMPIRNLYGEIVEYLFVPLKPRLDSLGQKVRVERAPSPHRHVDYVRPPAHVKELTEYAQDFTKILWTNGVIFADCFASWGYMVINLNNVFDDPRSEDDEGLIQLTNLDQICPPTQRWGVTYPKHEFVLLAPKKKPKDPTNQIMRRLCEIVQLRDYDARTKAYQPYSQAHDKFTYSDEDPVYLFLDDASRLEDEANSGDLHAYEDEDEDDDEGQLTF